jgi:Rieske Fe-S protein
VLGKVWRGNVLAEVVPSPLDPGQTTLPPATFKIRVSDYPALSQPFGSVRLGVNPVRPEVEPFPDGDFWPLLINRSETGEFYVLDSECQHASCVVPIYDDFNFGIRCPCHGSTYDIDGSVLTGPTENPLRRYDFEFDGDDTLTIQVPALAFQVNVALLPSTGNPRLQLDFETHYGITYQLYARNRLQDEWALTSFALSPGGPMDETSLFAIGAPASLYVERSAGARFYAVSMVLSEV